MEWIIEKGLEKEVEPGGHWINNNLREYKATEYLHHITVNRAQRQQGCIGGSTTRETDLYGNLRWYFIECHLPGPFPNNTFSTLGRVPIGTGAKYEYFEDISEALVWTCFYQFHSLLKETKELSMYERVNTPEFFASTRLLHYKHYKRH